jgi:acetolactate decarboxylase
MDKRKKSIVMWKGGTSFITSLVLAIFLLACGPEPLPEDQLSGAKSGTLFQVSVIDALLQGMYDGIYPIGELLKHGNTGIGTFNALEGEMVAINDTVFQVLASGQVVRPPLETTTPFAAIAPFKANAVYPLAAFTFDSLTLNFERYFPTRNIFYAIKINGEFEYMKTRSVPKQEKPYKPLVEVTAYQPEFEFHQVSGDIVGFYCPDYAKGINVTGMHLHFITGDRTGGGHILKFNLKSGTMKVGYLFDYRLILPEGGDFFCGEFSKARQEELEKVEK